MHFLEIGIADVGMFDVVAGIPEIDEDPGNVQAGRGRKGLAGDFADQLARIVFGRDGQDDLAGRLRDPAEVDLRAGAAGGLLGPLGKLCDEVGGPHIFAQTRGREDKPLISVGLQHDEFHSSPPLGY